MISNCSENDSRKCTILDFARVKKVKSLYLNPPAKFCGVPITHWDIQKSSLGLGLSWLWPLEDLVGSSLKAWLLVDLGWPTNALSVVISSAGYQRVVAAIKILGLSYEYHSIFE